MFTKSAGSVVDGINASGDVIDAEAVISLPSGGFPGFPAIPTGLPVLRNLAVLVNVGTQGSAPTIPQNAAGSAPFPVGAPDVVVPANAGAIAGDVFGVFQGPSQGALIPTTIAGSYTQGPITSPFGSFPVNTRLVCRKTGIGWVLAGAATGGNTIAVGQPLIVTPAQTFPYATRGVRAIGTSLGLVTAQPISTTLLTPAAAGSNAVQVAGFGVGLPALPQLVIDAGTPSQETVVPTVGANAVLASDTITVAGVPGIGTITVTFGGGTSGFPSIVVVVNLTAAFTATTAAAALVAAINASATTSGIASFLQAASNAAGVITIAQQASIGAAAANGIPVAAVATGGWTSVVATPTLAGGIAATFTAPFLFPHTAGATVQGIATSGIVLTVPAMAGLAVVAPVLCDLNVGS